MPQTVQYWAGFALIAVSFAPVVWAMTEFRRARTSFDVRKPSTSLITTGPFRFSRNPIYLAMTPLQLGIGIAVDGVWILAALVPALVAMHYGVFVREDRYLERKFGEAYRGYKTSVRRWL